MDKIIIYQVLPRLFGNTKKSNKPNGSLAENGCGKLADFNDKALAAIKKLGATHIWYTGIIEHATQTDYSKFGIKRDNATVVKGKAGSPYAIKDYYDVDPDLATDPKKRVAEFEDLVLRSHSAGLKVIMDFVPNHVARQYCSDAKPSGVRDLGEDDINTVSFNRDNNFYYMPGQQFSPRVPQAEGEQQYIEIPAKVTGNDCFTPSPSRYDWYETVKLNYGVDYNNYRYKDFFPTPSTWIKMRDILIYWTRKCVDGFRCDMAEMVPVEFWQWVIPQVKRENPEIIFIAETYDPGQYGTYLFNGHFDYLYDKVGLYDTLRAVMCGEQPTSNITNCWQSHPELEDRLLNFLENHDEQRVASDFFARNPLKGIPAMYVSAMLGKGPVMLYSGQEFGERGMDVEGFSGSDGRTSIFDYWSVSTLRRWVNGGKFDGKDLSADEKALQKAYAKIFAICGKEKAISEGSFFDLMYCNYENKDFNSMKQFAFLRHHNKELILVVSNFDDADADITVYIPQHAFDYLHLQKGKSVTARELVNGDQASFVLTNEKPFPVKVAANSAVVWKLKL